MKGGSRAMIAGPEGGLLFQELDDRFDVETPT
jgi:hypothetical protein